MAKTAQQKGSDFEDDIGALFSSWQERKPVTLMRLYDTKAAGSYLPAMPADFIGSFYGRPMLIEAKSSQKFDTMTGTRACLNSLVNKEQLAKMRIWARAGALTSVWFQSQETKTIEIFDGVRMFEVMHNSSLRLGEADLLTRTNPRAANFEIDIARYLDDQAQLSKGKRV